MKRTGLAEAGLLGDRGDAQVGVAQALEGDGAAYLVFQLLEGEALALQLAAEAGDAQRTFLGHVGQGGPVFVTAVAQLFVYLGAQSLTVAETHDQPLR
ncbi:hypothetical protein FQZ97_1154400 [compost metagenome]